MFGNRVDRNKMKTLLQELIDKHATEVLEEMFPAKEVHEAVDDFIGGLTLKFSLTGDDPDTRKEELGYCALLMAANQAFTDGIADKMASRLSTVVQEMYYANELPPESMERIRSVMEERGMEI